MVALALANLEPAALSKANMAACNNACWSLGAQRTARRACAPVPDGVPEADPGCQADRLYCSLNPVFFPAQARSRCSNRAR